MKEEIADMSISIGITENMAVAKRQQSAHSKRLSIRPSSSRSKAGQAQPSRTT